MGTAETSPETPHKRSLFGGEVLRRTGGPALFTLHRTLLLRLLLNPASTPVAPPALAGRRRQGRTRADRHRPACARARRTSPSGRIAPAPSASAPLATAA